MVEFKVVVLGSPEDILQAFVAGEGESFFETSTNLLESLVDLIVAYYVFDVSYPDNMSRILSFLQDFILEAMDSNPRSIKYSSFISELTSDVHV